MKHLMTLLGLAVLIPLLPQAALGQPLYTQEGTDPTFAEIMSGGRLPQGSNSTGGVTGSIIHVNKRLVEVGSNASQHISEYISLHTLANSAIRRKDFPKWTRWYQEDGNTQIFRLFKGETNVHNSRPLSARVETYSKLTWPQGAWHEWSGAYTIIKPEAACLFQVFSDKFVWAVHLDMDGEGNVIFDPRRDPKHKKIIAANMTGKPFFIRVRDNGWDYEVYLNNQKVGFGSFPRPGAKTGFRWGLYKGEHPVLHDAMVFVTGATFQ